MSNDDAYLQKYEVLFWRYYILLEQRVISTRNYIEFDSGNSEAFSLEYLLLHQAACNEIESVAKEISNHLNVISLSERPRINELIYALEETFPHLEQRTVKFLRGDFSTQPFKNWVVKLNKRSSRNTPKYTLEDGSSIPSWWNDHNKVKHDRSFQSATGAYDNFKLANQNNVLCSMAALFLINRLYMQIIDEDSYSYLEKSSLFALSGELDEIRSFLIYDKQGQISHMPWEP
ncbi:MAG TPA: hypothetical protein K8U80_05395 [Collinsella ihuae]|uniref:Uncharacterized protein n=1 Tax=Collinsella ihumii TaxID=1720204 RepID=A0A921IQH3_9ACTN|nr:hypothetical protein [Collinsella ihumii]